MALHFHIAEVGLAWPWTEQRSPPNVWFTVITTRGEEEEEDKPVEQMGPRN